MTVHLVGAGPGGPDLLTVLGARLLGRADAVVVDRLVDTRVVDLAAATATIIDVGKRPGGGEGSWLQADINSLLIELGRARECVVRLKGGDPFVFGRGGEELEALRAAGVDVQVVPGVSSAFAIPALAGVPVTSRFEASSVIVVSGHAAAPDTCAWDAIARSGASIVLLMAVANRAWIADQLIAGGLDPSTPVAAIERGATPCERRIATTLDELGDISIDAPAVIVVGAVARRLEPLRVP